MRASEKGTSQRAGVMRVASNRENSLKFLFKF
nr:MAG TPA: hypothetical protein [Caudoviricetes sp.]